MSAATGPRRFYETAAVEEGSAGFEVRLDGRLALTPARAPLAYRRKPLAEAVASEWAAQEEHIVPLSMPLTRLLTTAIDRGESEGSAWRAELVRFAGSDLLCYRAESPAELVRRQSDVWSSYLTWAEAGHGLRFAVTDGVMAVPQPSATLDAVAAHAERLELADVLALKGLAEMSGSYVLALAVAEKFVAAQDAFAASRLDETFQAEQWGVDAEAAAREQALQADFIALARFFELDG
ncbi:MAG: ATP12 family protein [Pseudomonadota bacterium]